METNHQDVDKETRGLTKIPDGYVPSNSRNTRSRRQQYGLNVKTNKETQLPSTWRNYVNTLNLWEEKLLRQTDNQQHDAVVNHILQEDNIDIVSDGGRAQGFGTFGWNIAGKNCIARGRGETEGPPELMQSFQAEGYGMLAALRSLYRTLRWKDTWPGTRKGITMHCDNIALVQRINWHFKRIVVTPKNVTAADYDVEKGITTTINILQKHNIIITVKHVKGHQDRKRAVHTLSKESKMNVEADKDATLAMQTHSYSTEYSPLPTTTTMLYKQGQPVTSKEAQTLRRAYLSQDLRKYIVNREKWHNTTPEKICWIAHHRAIQHMNSTNKTRILNLYTDACQRIKNSTTSTANTKSNAQDATKAST